jgi:adenine-specific DNA-methyltransferase
MTKIQLPVIDPIVRDKLLNALTVYFLDENSKLGLGITAEQISIICRNLLKESDYSFSSWHINEQKMFDEYRKEELAILDYLHLVSLDLRKQLGQYSTPVNIVKYILKSVNYISSRKISSKKLIDPSCGSGAFLVEATRVYLNALQKMRVPISEWYPMVVSAIAGIDIDPDACLFARLNLSMLLAPAILEYVSKNKTGKLRTLPVYCADTLESLASEKISEDFLYDSPNIRLKQQFDFVVGNPPYFKISGLNENLKNVFSASIYGHPNAYGLFIHAGIDMLKTKGKLGFIVPRSMLSGLYFKNLRNFIERKTSLNEITYISDRKKVFQNVLHGTMILSLQRNKANKKDVYISRVQSLNQSNINGNKIVVDRNSIIQRLNGTTVWFVGDSEETYRIIDRIVKQHPLLTSNTVNCQAKTGQIVWNRVKPLLKETASSDTLPLIWATDIGKFGFSFNRMGITRPPFLQVTSKTSGLSIKGSCLLVQRVTADEQTSRIVAGIPEKFCKEEKNGYFVENHLNIIQPVIKEYDMDLYFILAVLNSEIVEFFFRTMNGNTQVSATELNLLPIPKGRHEKDIAILAKRIQSASGDISKKRLSQDLNSLVAKAYGLTKDDLRFIKRFLYSRSKSDS